MRILVFSDSHGDFISMKIALSLHSEADTVLFLGDGEDDFKSQSLQPMLKNKITAMVSGNCDYSSSLPKEQLLQFGEKSVLFLHGHTKFVKYGLSDLIASAKEKKADIVLYGHTHKEMTDYVDGMHIMCPGSIRNGFYGIVDITNNGVVCFTCDLNKKL